MNFGHVARSPEFWGSIARKLRFDVLNFSLEVLLLRRALGGLPNVNLDVQISWQARHFVNADGQTSWQYVCSDVLALICVF